MKTCLAKRITQPKVSRLRELLGLEAVLLPCIGKRPITPGWQKLTAAAMDDPAHIEALESAPNIGVLLGKASGGLCVVDIDQDGEDEEFLALNPLLADTLRTQGRRGSSFWVRCEGNFPASKKLGALGEWRADGNQSIIFGPHPQTDKPYIILNEAAPARIAFAEITWPSGVSFHPPTPFNKPLPLLCRSGSSVDSVASGTSVFAGNPPMSMKL